jgi:Transglutaminase-like superfamily
MKRQLFKLAQLKKSDRQAFLEAYLLLSLIRLGLWLLPFGKLQKVLDKITKINSLPRFPLGLQIKQIVAAVDRSSKYSPGNVKCLARALATEVLLTKYGYCPLLKIGVAKGEQGKLEAHAWVEEQEKIVIGDLQDLDKFKVFPALKKESLEIPFK